MMLTMISDQEGRCGPPPKWPILCRVGR